MSEQKHTLMVIPGLGDGERWLAWMMQNWEKQYGISPHFHPMYWSDKEQTYEGKLRSAQVDLEILLEENALVSILGVSGGGSVAVKLFADNLDNINKVVNLAGRIQPGWYLRPSLALASAKHPAFMDSVVAANAAARKLTLEERAKILTLRPVLDEKVPTSTVSIMGAKDKVIPSVTHVLSIAVALAFPQAIIEHLKNEK